MMNFFDDLFFALSKIKKGNLGIKDPGVTLNVLDWLLRSIALFSVCFKRLYFLDRIVIKKFIKIISTSISKSN